MQAILPAIFTPSTTQPCTNFLHHFDQAHAANTTPLRAAMELARKRLAVGANEDARLARTAAGGA